MRKIKKVSTTVDAFIKELLIFVEEIFFHLNRESSLAFS